MRGVVIIKSFPPNTKEKSEARINLRREPEKGQKLIFCFRLYICTLIMHKHYFLSHFQTIQFENTDNPKIFQFALNSYARVILKGEFSPSQHCRLSSQFLFLFSETGRFVSTMCTSGFERVTLLKFRLNVVLN